MEQHQERAYSLNTTDIIDICNTSPLGEYVVIEEDSVRFRDLVTREPLKPGIVPPGVLLHPSLGTGIRYLQKRGEQSDMGVDFILAPHGAATDFLRARRAHPTQFSPSLIGVEASWRRPNSVSYPLPQAVEPLVCDAGGRQSFQRTQFAWLKKHNIQMLPVEIPENDTSELASELHKLWDEVYTPATNDESLSPPVRNAIRTISERAYQTTRQWAILAQFGQWLVRLDAAGQLDRSEIIPIILGSWHARSADRLMSFGVYTRSFEVPSKWSEPGTPHKAYGDLVMKCMADGAAPLELINTPTPY